MPFEVNVKRPRVTLRHIRRQSDGKEIDRKKKKLPHALKLIFESSHIVFVRQEGYAALALPLDRLKRPSGLNWVLWRRSKMTR